MILGLELGIVVGTAIEEVIKIGLFVFFKKRAFYTVIVFAILEIILVKSPFLFYMDFELIAYIVVFSILGFIFHFSTAILYDHLFSNQPNTALFYMILGGVVIIHIVYNTVDRIIEDGVAIAVFALGCSLTILGIYKIYNMNGSTSLE